MGTPLRAIRQKCLDCSGGQRSEVKNCMLSDCPLFLYRFGKNPKRSGIGPKKGGFSQNIQTQLSKSA
jgi:hypothetical protein